MPPKGLELYELKYGADAQRLLDEALLERDYQKLIEVTRRYFHTKAGYAATMLLGRQYLDQGRPLAAALTFQRLAAAQYALPQYDPELSVLLSTCWLFANMPERAEATLVALKNRAPTARLRVGGKEMALFEQEHRPSPGWTSSSELGFTTNAPEETEWTVHRGNAARNAETAADLPLLHARWRVRTANHPSDEELIRQRQAEYRDRGVAAIAGTLPAGGGRRDSDADTATADRGRLRNGKTYLGIPLVRRSGRAIVAQRPISSSRDAMSSARSRYSNVSGMMRPTVRSAAMVVTYFLLWELGTADPTTRSVIVGAQGVVGPDPEPTA